MIKNCGKNNQYYLNLKSMIDFPAIQKTKTDDLLGFQNLIGLIYEKTNLSGFQNLIGYHSSIKNQ